MLFEAEKSLQELNVKVLAQLKENQSIKDQGMNFEEVKAQLEIEREENANLKKVTDQLQAKLLKAVEEKEMFLNELIRAKTKQAEILDEANRVHAAAQKKASEVEIQKKRLTELAANRDTFEVVNFNEGLGDSILLDQS